MNLGLRTPGILKISPRGALTLWVPKSASWQLCLRPDSSILWISRAMRNLGVRGALSGFLNRSIHLHCSRTLWCETLGECFLVSTLKFSSCETWSYCLTHSYHLEMVCVKVKVKVAQSCPTLCNPMGYTVHGILQARILEWVAFPFSRGSSQSMDRTQVSPLQADSLPAEPQGGWPGVGSLSFLQWIFPTQESNRDLLHCRQILYQVSDQGCPCVKETKTNFSPEWSKIYPRHRRNVNFCISLHPLSSVCLPTHWKGDSLSNSLATIQQGAESW